MKEATGELNMTVITVVAIAAVAAFFYAFVWPRIKSTINSSSICANGANYTAGSPNTVDYVSCGALDTSSGSYTCDYYEDNNGTLTAKSVTCKQK